MHPADDFVAGVEASGLLYLYLWHIQHMSVSMCVLSNPEDLRGFGSL